MSTRVIKPRDRVRTPDGRLGTVSEEGSDYMFDRVKVLLDDGPPDHFAQADLDLVERPANPADQ